MNWTPWGTLTSVGWMGLNSIIQTLLSAPRKLTAWSIPPPSVPIYRSHLAHSSAKSFLLSRSTLLVYAVVRAAQHTRAEEFERPAHGGMLPSMRAQIEALYDPFETTK